MGERRADCPCVKTKCERHKDCDACRDYHKTMVPYCERDVKKNRNRRRDRKRG